MLPAVRRIVPARCPLPIGPLSLVHVIGGELLLRGEPGTHRLLAGELLAVRGAVEVCLEARGGGEALLFHADPGWVDGVRRLFGASNSADGPVVSRERAGSALALRAGRLLVAAHLEASQEHAQDQADASRIDGLCGAGAGRLVELAGIADSMTGSLVDPRRPAGARKRSRRASLVRALEDLEPGGLEGFSVGLLADRLGVSVRQTSRLVRAELGTSLPAYLAALRVERARKLLAQDDRTITEIALETGWRSLSHFNAVFRRYVGMTPSALRAVESCRAGRALRPVDDTSEIRRCGGT